MLGISAPSGVRPRSRSSPARPTSARGRSGRRRRSRTPAPPIGLDGLRDICALRLDPGRRDRRHRRVERRRVHPGRRGRRRGHPRRAPRSKRCGRLSMRLSDARRARSAARAGGTRADRGHRARRRRASRWARRHPGRSRGGRPLPARLHLLARARLPCGGREPQRSRGVRGAEPEALVRHARRCQADAELERGVELYEGLAEAGVPVRGGDTTTRRQTVVSVTAVGRSERVPGRAARGPATCSSSPGPLGAAGAAFRERRVRAAAAADARGNAAGCSSRTRCSTSRTGSRSTPATSRARSGCRVVIDLDARPAAPGATLDDLGFGEDYELLAAVADERRSVPGDRPL